jgi:hypothetical protein
MPSREDDCPANLKQIIRELETVLPPLPRSGSVQHGLDGLARERERAPLPEVNCATMAHTKDL